MPRGEFVCFFGEGGEKAGVGLERVTMHEIEINYFVKNLL